MAKNSINEFSTTAASNTDIGGIGIQGTNAVSNFDGAFRELMSQLAEMNAGTSPIYDTMRWCDPADNTKLFRFDGVGVTTGTIRVLTIPDASGTIPLLGLSQTWSGTQTFPTLTVSGATPTITMTDTDTGADNTISANNSTGSLVISADANNEVATSQILFQVDGGTKLSVASTGTTTAFGDFAVTGTTPVITMTDTDTGAISLVTASNSTGSLILSADNAGTVANSIIGFNVDGAQKASIDSAGDWNVGTFSATGASIGYTYDVSEGIVRTSQNASTSKFHFAFYNTNGVVGSITTNGTATTFATSSDYRRKPVREDLSGFWQRLNGVKPVRFQWDSGQWDTGFIAHEFAEVYPSSVIGEKDAVDADGNPVYQSMQASTSPVIADIIAALQDINNRLSSLGA